MSLTAAPSVLDVFEAAAHDETGALVRRAWIARAERDLAAAGPGRRPAVLLADLDHFKHCNDTFGHLAGDHVLAEVVWVIRTELCHVDLVGRFGGDELALLLGGDLGVREAVGVGERIRRRVAALRVRLPGEPTRSGRAGREVSGLTVSVGVATPRAGAVPGLPVLLAAADAALYAAKDAGRNAVCAAEAGAGPHVPVAPRHAR